MKRTNKEWYNLLTPEQKVKFNQNCARENYLKDTKRVDRVEFLSGAFLWNTTPQGHDYWSKIANKKEPKL